MSSGKYIQMALDGQPVDFDVSGDFPVSFDYQLEDTAEFQKKKSSEALNIKLPATPANDALLNSFYDLSADDTTPDSSKRGLRRFTAEVAGQEFLTGKALLNRVTRQHGKPKLYEISAFGNNADWMIDLKEITLYELVKHITFVFSEATITGSWAADGTDENLPYVFAPVKYADFMDMENRTDDNYSITAMKPALFKFWIIYWAFKSLGYKIKSDFLDSDYYRRMTMPWTFGSFLTSSGTKYDVHLFLAKTSGGRKYKNGSTNNFWDLAVSNDSNSGAFDNNTENHPGVGDYEWFPGLSAGSASSTTPTVAPGTNAEMRWTYKTPDYGQLEAHFSATLDIDCGCNGSTSEVNLVVCWYKNGTLIERTTVSHLNGPFAGGNSDLGVKTVYFSSLVALGDTISARVHLYQHAAKFGYASSKAQILEFKLDYFRIPVGGTIFFDSYLGLQKEKFLDFLRGEADLWNLSFQTDPINKVVCIEPTHAYPTENEFSDKNEGYFIAPGPDSDWTDKVDHAREAEITLFNDYERELVFKFREDAADGAFKVVQDRNLVKLSNAKYLFPDRFKSGKREVENRYYSATMHYEAASFKDVTGVAPQLICLVPENISNTSSSEAENTFAPRSAYYKGLVSGVGGWKFNGATHTNIPYMFAVNYKPGGENDPVISYCDERIGAEGSYVLAKGLLKRFFWQRLAIMRNGQYLTENLMLSVKDITNWFHRERIILNGNTFELYSIKNYRPLDPDAAQCQLRRFIPVSQKDLEATYPTEGSVLSGTVDGSSYDLNYNRLMCLATDIPTPDN